MVFDRQMHLLAQAGPTVFAFSQGSAEALACRDFWGIVLFQHVMRRWLLPAYSEALRCRQFQIGSWLLVLNTRLLNNNSNTFASGFTARGTSLGLRSHVKSNQLKPPLKPVGPSAMAWDSWSDSTWKESGDHRQWTWRDNSCGAAEDSRWANSYHWQEAAWGDTVDKDDGHKSESDKEAKGHAADAEMASSSAKASGNNQGPSKWSSWLSDEEFIEVHGYDRHEPKPRGKKHDWNQLQRVTAFHVQTAKKAAEDAKAQAEDAQLRASLSEAHKFDAEAASAKAQERVVELETLLAEEQQNTENARASWEMLVEAKDSILVNYTAVISCMSAAATEKEELFMGMQYQNEVLEDEIAALEGLSNDLLDEKEDLEAQARLKDSDLEEQGRRKDAEIKDLKAQFSKNSERKDAEINDLKAQLAQSRHAEERGRRKEAENRELQRKLGEYMMALDQWRRKAHQLRDRLRMNNQELDLHEDCSGPVYSSCC